MEELKKKFLFLENLLTLSSRKNLLIFFLSGAILIGFGIFFFKSDIGSSGTKVKVLNATTEGQEGGEEITVEIAGEVETPGVYKLSFGARVEDLLTISGGLSANANRNWVEKYLNRAAKLIDSQKVYIPSQSEILTAKEIGDDQSGSSQFTSQGSGLTNINISSLSELDKLPGIGPVYGQNIIDHRPYSTVEELLSKGILKKNVYEKIKDMVGVY
ncbi:MAG: helix-hairpin-helix domain-containing protein [Patescibacteria group bacterium]|mgnify:CR=1 FL=1